MRDRSRIWLAHGMLQILGKQIGPEVTPSVLTPEHIL
jgi:hypothetical protein